MKTTIITIYDPRPNYGNRLQNYAVQCILEKFGCQVETASYEKEHLDLKIRIKYLLQKLFHYQLPGDKTYWQCYVPKLIAFSAFNKKYIKTKLITDISHAKSLQTDYFVLGSDQVWNPEWYQNCPLKKDLFLLTFASSEQKVCFSPSFGVEEVPEEWRNWFAEYLPTFPNISVRENAGAKIVRDLSGQDATVLIDPTMMLDASEWMKIAREPQKVKCDKPYILTYFLGGCSERIQREMQKYALENDLAIYDLMDYAQPNLFMSGPCEFVYLISHANLVMTDSFHACVFSFLFQKPFLVYERGGNTGTMMSRMDTLLETFDLKRKYADSKLPNDIFECDYSNGYRQLELERTKAEVFLRKSLKIK